MAHRTFYNIIDEYQFLKKKIKKLEIKGKQSNRIPQHRIAQKMAAVYRRLKEIEKECKERGLPHPDAFNNNQSDYITKMLADHPIKSIPRSVHNPDGTLYSKNQFGNQTNGLDKLVVKSTPDGRLFETPALEGSFMPRKGAD